VHGIVAHSGNPVQRSVEGSWQSAAPPGEALCAPIAGSRRCKVVLIILDFSFVSGVALMKDERAEEHAIVYVVDDDPSVRGALESLIRSAGMQAKVFSSAPEFLRTSPSDSPSCLVLDVRLPDVNGLDFQSMLAKANMQIPIVFITGHGDIPMTVRAMKSGAVEFLTKPFRDQDLLDAVRIGLERDRNRRRNENLVSGLKTRFGSLTPREQQVMAFVTAGLMNKQVADKLGVTEITVKVHRGNVMRKMGARSLAELVRMTDLLGVHRPGP
jgi:FixJ family two-component response regulator